MRWARPGLAISDGPERRIFAEVACSRSVPVLCNSVLRHASLEEKTERTRTFSAKCNGKVRKEWMTF